MNPAERTPRILVTRLSALGDCILTLPLVNALRDQFPSALIVWAAEPLSASLLRQQPAIDEVITVPKRWLRSLSTVRQLRSITRKYRFDWAIDPQSLAKSGLLAWTSGAKRRVGFARPRGREGAPLLMTERVVARSTHLVDATLELLDPIGVTSRHVRFDLPRFPEAGTRVDRFLLNACLTGPFAVINAGASQLARQWPADRYGRVARRLGEDLDLPTVVTWSGAQEQEWTHTIIEKSGGHALPAPPTDLEELRELLFRARFAIGSDTGPMHLAAAGGTPCVGLHGPTRPEHSGVYGPEHVTIGGQPPGRRYGRRDRTDQTEMRTIDVEQVMNACRNLLSRPARSSGIRRGQAA